jgi:hypothetical protein
MHWWWGSLQLLPSTHSLISAKTKVDSIRVKLSEIKSIRVSQIKVVAISPFPIPPTHPPEWSHVKSNEVFLFTTDYSWKYWLTNFIETSIHVFMILLIICQAETELTVAGSFVRCESKSTRTQAVVSTREIVTLFATAACSLAFINI